MAQRTKTMGVYKYIHKKLGVIYVGQSSRSFETRIKQHATEDKFLPYLDDCDIYVCCLPNKSVTVAMEALLIDHYRPLLNVYAKNDNPYVGKFPELEWLLYKTRRQPDEHVTNNNNSIGQRIKLLRVARGLTQTELAQLAGYREKSAISRIESGTNDMPITKMKLIAAALGVQLEYLISSNANDERG